MRPAGALTGALGGVAAIHAIPGWWGYPAGLAVFVGCAALADRVWRRRASPEEIRQDLEDRARDTLP